MSKYKSEAFEGNAKSAQGAVEEAMKKATAYASGEGVKGAQFFHSLIYVRMGDNPFAAVATATWEMGGD